MCLQPVADGGSGLVHGRQLFPRLRVLHELLHTYNDVQGQQGENAETIRRDIAGILHTLNQAYENLYNNLLSDVAMDISSEIAALQGMLANDGLTGREFE